MSKKKLPFGWVEVSLGNAFLIERGGSPRPIQDYLTDKDDGINWIKIGDTSTESKYITFAKEKIIPDGVKKSRMVFEGDFLLSNSMSFGRPYISKIRGCIHDGWLVIRKNEKVENDYLYYILKSPQCYNQFCLLAKGSTVKNLNIQAVSKVIIPLPPLPEQQRIVAKLHSLIGHLDSLREKLDRIPALLKNFRQQVLTQAVTGELTREWREGKGLGEWGVQKADKCCQKVQSGGTPKKDGFSDSGIPFLKVYNIVNNKVDFDYRPQFVTPEAHNSKIKKSILLPRDVLMNIVGPPLNKIAIVPDDYDEWNLNQAITLFRPKEYLNNKFLYYFFCEGSSVRSVHNETRGVVGQVNISLSQCRNFDIPIPSIEEQQEIVKRVEALFSLADKINSKYQSLKIKVDQLPQAILAKAFRGELVSQEMKEYVVEEREGLLAVELGLKNL